MGDIQQHMPSFTRKRISFDKAKKNTGRPKSRGCISLSPIPEAEKVVTGLQKGDVELCAVMTEKCERLCGENAELRLANVLLRSHFRDVRNANRESDGGLPKTMCGVPSFFATPPADMFRCDRPAVLSNADVQEICGRIELWRLDWCSCNLPGVWWAGPDLHRIDESDGDWSADTIHALH